MKSIPSFTVDHINLKCGVYVSRVDFICGKSITTYDVRFYAPSEGKYILPEAMHTIEHLSATWLRNQNKSISDRIIYWGPMGCMTGCYLIMKGSTEPSMVVFMIESLLRFIVSFQEGIRIPGTKDGECGNPEFHNIIAAKEVAKEFLENIKNGNYETTYPCKK